jgi:PAS domain S-box-containing protein
VNRVPPLSRPTQPDTNVELGIKKAFLRLVKGGPERLAIEAGQIDAVIDPTNGNAILLPEAQRALIERRVGFRSLLGLAFDWYWEQNEHHCFISYRGASDEAFGVTEAEIIGKTLWNLPIDALSDTDWPTHRQQLEWRVNFRDLEVRHVNSTGQVRYLSISGEPIFDDCDRFKGYRGITRDITERKQADGLVWESNRFAQTILDSRGDPIGVLDRAGVVISSNQAWRSLAAIRPGIGAGVVQGGSYLAVCDSAVGDDRVDGATIAAAIRQVISGDRLHFHYDYAFESPTGRCWLELLFTAVAGIGPARAIISAKDITERKRGELLLTLEREVQRTLAEAAGLPDALKSVIRAVCEAEGWDCGRYFSLDRSAGVLRMKECWGLSSAVVQKFLVQSRDMVFRTDAGLAGRAYQSGQLLWTLDPIRNADASSRALAPETGDGSALVIPVTGKGGTIGVLAFSSRLVRTPDERKLQTMEFIGHQLGRFLQQQKEIETLREHARHLRLLIDVSCDWSWKQDNEYRFTEVVGSHPFGGAEIIGLTHWELPNVVLAKAQWEKHQSHLAERWCFRDLEFAVVRPDEKHSYYSISGAPMYDEAGVFSGYCGTGLDITVR